MWERVPAFENKDFARLKISTEIVQIPDDLEIHNFDSRENP
jgi:hypothetical protein